MLEKVCSENAAASIEQTKITKDDTSPTQHKIPLEAPKSPAKSSVISLPSKDPGVSQKARGKAIAAPTFKAKTREVNSVYFDSVGDEDKPFNILEHLKTHVKKVSEKTSKQKQEKASGEIAPKRSRGRPKKVAETSNACVTSTNSDPTSIPQLDQSLFTPADSCSNSQEMPYQKRGRDIPTVKTSSAPESIESAIQEGADLSEVPVKRAKNLKRKNKVLPNKHIVQAINEYTGSRPLDLSILPLDALCHSNITYGKHLEKPAAKPSRQATTKRQSSPPPPLNVPKAANVLAVQVKIVDGNLVYDNSEQLTRQSLTNAPDYSSFDVVEEGAAGRYINCMTYVKRLSNARWSSEDTDKFYEALAKWGSDFERIAKEFPERERRHLVKKFKREEKKNPTRINEAILHRLHTPVTPST
ncbi:hypothetical protein DSO57_1019454 [Entomophthora muscae]|uniref:Uncharacterized protein n=1 Tax=Entomophthora muscae TaxID=34485 RepID=A0ACC2RVC5_9FUNG|nr:hypothetical protein DSO57_1019454 [Entomophthora muscae]